MKTGSTPPPAPVTKKNTPGNLHVIKKEKRLTSSQFNISKNRELQKLPLIKDANPNEREALFIKKLQQVILGFYFLNNENDIYCKSIF